MSLRTLGIPEPETHLHVFEHHITVVELALQEPQLQQLQRLSLKVRVKIGLLYQFATQHAPAQSMCNDRG